MKKSEVTVNEAMAILGVSKTAIHQMIQSGRIPARMETLGGVRMYVIPKHALKNITVRDKGWREKQRNRRA